VTARPGDGAVVLGIDPGLASFGACALELPGRRVVGADVFRSAPSPRKRSVAVTDDRYRRARELAAWFEASLDRWRPVAVAAEAMSFPRSGIAIASMALAWGVLAAVANRRALPMVQVTPQEWKRCMSGRKGVPDVDLYPLLERRGGDAVAAALTAADIPRGQHVHALDALGVALWSANAELVMAALGGTRGAPS
jgi:Holliday junction resolvasome RuvABC endonuclease subunit